SVRQLLQALARDGVTVLLSSHLLGEVEEVCTHLVVMDRGRLVAQGTVADLTSAGRRTAYLEVDDVAAAKRILATLTGVQSVTAAPPGRALDLDAATHTEIVASLVQGGVGVETVMQRHGLEEAFVG